MSLESKQIIECPKCRQENEFTVWRSLNGDLDPKAKRQLLDGKLFTYECKCCGHTADMCYEMLYHDMKHKVMIHFVREEDVENTKAMLGRSKGFMASDKQLEDKMQGYRNRIVTDANTLREKADIFHNGLDDRIIEILKLVYHSDLLEQNPDAQVDNIYFYIEGDKYLLCFMSAEPFSVEMPEDMYKDFERELKKEFSAMGDEELIIDKSWAISFLNTDVVE